MYHIRLIVTLLTLLFNLSLLAQPSVEFKGELLTLGKDIEILTDSNSDISAYAAVKSKSFVRSADLFPNLYTTNYSYWVKINIENKTNLPSLALQIAQPGIDYISFYQIQSDSILKSYESGHRKPFFERPILHQTYIYPVSFENQNKTTVLLHIKSGKQLILPIYLGTTAQVFEGILVKDIFFGVYMGIILIMLFYNLFIYTTVKDKNYLYYILYLAIVLLTQASMEGYVFKYILPNSPALADITVYISTALIGIAAVEFSKKFLISKVYAPTLHKASYLFWLAYSIQILLALTGRFNESYTTMLICAMWSAIYVLAMAIYILLKGSRSAKFFLIAWSGFILCVVVYVLKDFGVLPYNNITSSALLIGSAFEAVMISFALADRINVFKAEKEKSQQVMLETLQENERIVREQNIVLEQKVNERTAELKEANEELTITLEDLKQTQSQLVAAEKMASLGQLTAGIAHEINNPINFVTSNVSPLQRDVKMLIQTIETYEEMIFSEQDAEEKRQQIEEHKEDLDYDYLKIEIDHLLKGINEGASRTAEIVKGLRIFSRVDEDDLKVANILEGLDSTLVIMNSLINSSNISVTKHYEENIPQIECYPGKLNQVFLNIISNSIYAINQIHKNNSNGNIDISVKTENGTIIIDMKDNGCGIAEHNLTKIFDPFFTTKDVGEGTGLGMSIAYNTIKKHNGDIGLFSEVDKGTLIRITLPVKQNSVAPQTA